jgi:hypothetical protein
MYCIFDEGTVQYVDAMIDDGAGSYTLFFLILQTGPHL